MTASDWIIVCATIGGLFLFGALRLSNEATEQPSSDRPDGDTFPYVPQVFPTSHGTTDSDEREPNLGSR